MWSSFPRGEKRTGILRSTEFQLPENFSFYMAGHDGYLDEPRNQKNLVRLLDASSGKALTSWNPPRSDVAQAFHLGPKDNEWTGKSVFLELVDGDDSRAFAWIAVGRFSIDELNPSTITDNRRKGLKLVRDFRLKGLYPKLVSLLSSTKKVSPTYKISPRRNDIAATLASLRNLPGDKALAELLSIENLSPPLRESVEHQLCLAKPDHWPLSLFEKAMPLASSSEQLAVTKALASRKQTVGTLVQLAASGRMSPRLLADASVNEQLKNSANSAELKIISELTSNLPPEDAGLFQLVNKRTHSFRTLGGESAVGAQIFQEKCAICHQVAGQGKAVGPNLDGIGKRGLARVMEDVLMPNRNVDVAFQSTTLLTADGNVLNGLLRDGDGTQLTLINSSGKEIQIPKNEIEQQNRSSLSSMPANFGSVLDERQTRDLMSFLLKL